MVFRDITSDTKEKYVIDTSGDHIFFLYNRNGDIVFSIEHPDAKVYVHGLFIGKNVQRAHLSLSQKHTCPNALSEVIIQSILYDGSQLDIYGNITIHKNGAGTRASFDNKNLILGKKALITSRPTLNILNHDVQCSHSATSSKPNDDEVLYMQYRTLDRKKAEELFIHGIINAFFIKLEKKNINVRHLITSHLPENIYKSILHREH